MASFLGGQEKADVASLAKQAGNVSVWNKQNPINLKGNDDDETKWRDKMSFGLLDWIYPFKPFSYHTHEWLCDLTFANFYLEFVFI